MEENQEEKIRTDKKKKLWKVAEELLNNPLQTIREVSEKTWVSKSTVANYINEDLDKLGQKDERIIAITDKDFELMNLIQEEKFRRIKEEKDKINNTDINKWEETATRRYQIFKWNITDKNWGLNSLDEILNQIQGL